MWSNFLIFMDQHPAIVLWFWLKKQNKTNSTGGIDREEEARVSLAFWKCCAVIFLVLAEDFLILGRYNAPNGMSVSLLLGVLLCNDSSLFLSLCRRWWRHEWVVGCDASSTYYTYYVLCVYMERTRVHWPSLPLPGRPMPEILFPDSFRDSSPSVQNNQRKYVIHNSTHLKVRTIPN